LDTNITIGLRKGLVEELDQYFKSKGYQNYTPVLRAIESVPRHQFIPFGFEHLAYNINPVLIDNEQTMSSPLTVALQTHFLHVDSSDKILEIGTGSGYQACILSKLCKEVHSMERQQVLHDKASRIFHELKLKNIYTYLKDGFEGLPNIAPFDKIIITCAAPEIPNKLIPQLKVGGIMLIPLDNEDGSQTMIRLIKQDEESIYEESLGIYNFVPMLKGLNKD
jgi:protein-L-isoaspartate(D-aspartate) O-methyltransferase